METKTNPMLLCDFYKVSHREQYPVGTEKVFSTWTPRKSRIKGINNVVAFGFQGFIKEYLIEYFNDNFFNQPVEDVVNGYKRIISNTLGVKDPDTSHIEALHLLGYLPIRIKAVEEGTLVPIRVPMLTIENTVPEFFWVTNYLETLMSNYLWMPTTSATIAFEYKKVLMRFAEETNGEMGGVGFQGHDFSMRGMGSVESAMTSGAGHLTSFVGTDTIPAIHYIEQNYGGNVEKELIGTSIPATEHSVQCAGGKNNEFDTYKRLVTETYPNGFVSIVSDTWDLWEVLNKTIRGLKKEILARDGRVVIRPDSGDPVKIICGDEDSDNEFERKGVIQILWEIFGGTTTAKGFKQLDSHIGCIYGDAITIDRCKEICKRLKSKGYSSLNMVFGIGSYTYQYNTRDTFGFALKSTYAVINGEEVKIFKDPVTDKGDFKKSQYGLVCVLAGGGDLHFVDNLTAVEREALKEKDMLKDLFIDGKLVREDTFVNIRDRLAKNL